MLMIQLFFCDFDNVNAMENVLNTELVKFTKWLACTQLSLNIDNTKLIYFF